MMVRSYLLIEEQGHQHFAPHQPLCAVGLKHGVHVTLHLALGDAVVANGTDLQQVPPSIGAMLGAAQEITHEVAERG